MTQREKKTNVIVVKDKKSQLYTRTDTRCMHEEGCMRQTAAWYRTLVEQLPVMTYVAALDKTSTTLYVSPQVKDFLGFTFEEFESDPSIWWKQLHEDDRDRVLNEVAKSHELGAEFSSEYRMVTKDGRTVWFLDKASVVRGPDGNSASLQGVMYDITERKKVEEELRLHTQIISNMDEGVYLIQARDGIIIYTNPAFDRLFGYDLGELIGKHVSIVNAPTVKDAEESAKEIISQLGRTGKWEGEIQNIRKDGTLFWCRAVVSTFEHSEYGHVWVSVHMDITDRKNSEEQQRKLLDDINERMKELRCIYGIATLLRGCSTLEEIFQNTVNLIPHGWRYPEITRAMVCFAGAEYASEPFEPTQWEQSSDIIVNNERCGSIRVYYIEERPLSDEGPFLKEERNLIDSIAQTISETIEHKQAEAQLKVTQDKLIEAAHMAGMAEVATNILHNVGNVLNSINISANSIRDMVLNSRTNNLRKVTDMICEHKDDLGIFLMEDERGKHIPTYLEEVGRLMADEQAGIAEKIRSLTRNLEYVKQVIQSQQKYAKAGDFEVVTSVSEIIEDAFQINKEGLVRCGVSFHVELAELPNIHIDRQRVLQILVNLICNGIYAVSKSQKQEKILIVRSYVQGGDKLRIEVTDNGMGISKENITKIFRHGFTTKEKGHGFGLHSGFLVAQELGGSLTAHSDGLEHGATFTLELPLKVEAVTNECTDTMK